jgi:hypothetical protein
LSALIPQGGPVGMRPKKFSSAIYLRVHPCNPWIKTRYFLPLYCCVSAVGLLVSLFLFVKNGIAALFVFLVARKSA